MALDKTKAIEIENMLSSAAESLRCAWLQMKRNGLESSAKELADTVLDVEESAKLIGKYIDGDI